MAQSAIQAKIQAFIDSPHNPLEFQALRSLSDIIFSSKSDSQSYSNIYHDLQLSNGQQPLSSFPLSSLFENIQDELHVDLLKSANITCQQLEYIVDDIAKMKQHVDALLFYMKDKQSQINQLITSGDQMIQKETEINNKILAFDQFLSYYSLTPDQINHIKTGDINHEFFKYLQKLKSIQNDSIHQAHFQVMSEIFDGVTSILDTSYNRIITFLKNQNHSAFLFSPDLHHFISSSFSILQDTSFFSSALSELSTKRRVHLLQHFVDSLSSYDINSCEFLSYLQQMFSFIHQCLVTETDIILQLLQQNSINKEIISYLDDLFEPVISLLEKRVKNSISPLNKVLSLYQSSVCIKFYETLFTKIYNSQDNRTVMTFNQLFQYNYKLFSSQLQNDIEAQPQTLVSSSFYSSSNEDIYSSSSILLYYKDLLSNLLYILSPSSELPLSEFDLQQSNFLISTLFEPLYQSLLTIVNPLFKNCSLLNLIDTFSPVFSEYSHLPPINDSLKQLNQYQKESIDYICHYEVQRIFEISTLDIQQIKSFEESSSVDLTILYPPLETFYQQIISFPRKLESISFLISTNDQHSIIQSIKTLLSDSYLVIYNTLSSLITNEDKEKIQPPSYIDMLLSI